MAKINIINKLFDRVTITSKFIFIIYFCHHLLNTEKQNSEVIWNFGAILALVSLSASYASIMQHSVIIISQTVHIDIFKVLMIMHRIEELTQNAIKHFYYYFFLTKNIFIIIFLYEPLINNYNIPIPIVYDTRTYKKGNVTTP
jgi:hypothetical protein